VSWLEPEDEVGRWFPELLPSPSYWAFSFTVASSISCLNRSPHVQIDAVEVTFTEGLRRVIEGCVVVDKDGRCLLLVAPQGVCKRASGFEHLGRLECSCHPVVAGHGQTIQAC